jgi:hypothetical protein
MKKFKLTKIIANVLVVASVLALNPIGVSAAWREDSHGWWFTEGNSWAKGWRNIDGSWYYFYSNGYMAHDTMIDGYYLNSSGVWTDNTTYMTPTEAEQKVRQYLINNGKYVPSKIEYDHEENNAYVIHCYDIVVDHTATSGWYYVDKSTGNITSMF